MADPDERADVDRTLERALEVWEALPAMEAESLSWDGEELEVYLAELAIATEDVYWLREHRHRGAMTPAQERRHDELERVFSANRIRARRLREDVEWELGRALAAWSELPQIAEEIAGWDEIERIAFVHEWPLQEMRLERLRGYAGEGDELMTEEQRGRYGELEELVARNRPIIEGLLERYLG